MTTFSPFWFSAHSSRSTSWSPAARAGRFSSTLPRQVMTSPSRTRAAKRTEILPTRPTPTQSVTDWATKPIDSMPWAKTPPIPAARAKASSWWMGLKSPEAPA